MKTKITHYSNASSEGVTLHLSEKTSLKTGKVKGHLFWVSWDKIGSALFDNYQPPKSMKHQDNLNVLKYKMEALHWEVRDTRVELLNHIEKSRNEITNYMHTLAQWAEDRRPQKTRGVRSCRRNVNY